MTRDVYISAGGGGGGGGGNVNGERIYLNC